MASRRSSRSELEGGWTLWPQVLVRGAGFPFSWLDEVVQRADLSRALREVAAEPLFREAVTWQNRAAVADGLDSLLRKPEGATDSKTRKKELLVVRYLQRYCAKNDTIGFFGPVGWGRWGDGAGRARFGARLIDARRAFVEPWAARVLADARSQHGDALVRLPGDLRVVKRTLVTPTARYTLTAEDAAALQQLQDRGPRPARRFSPELLARLVANNLVRCSFPVAISHEPLAAVPGLEGFRAQVDALAEPGLAEKLAQLERDFVAATEHAAKRHEGRTYGGRGLVYEECRRDVDLELSEAMRARVAKPLAIVLQVARWYTFEISRLLTRKLAQRHPGNSVPLHVFWADTAALFSGERPAVIAPVADRLKKKWSALWGAQTTLALDEAARLVKKQFAAPCPGWPGARHHAPDLMWAAPSVDAMLRGEGTPVLGELHPGVTPFTTLSVLAHAPDRPALERQWKEDFGEDGITPIPWEDFARSSQDARLSKRHWHLDLGNEFESARPQSRVLRAADFDVVSRKGRLVAVHRVKKLAFDLVVVFERRLKMLAATHFSLGDGSETGPRKLLGDLVVQRAHWRFTREELAFLDEPEGRAERVRAFVAQRGLPRRVFVRSPEEVKPVYVDWEAPVLVEMLTRLARQAPWLSCSEMLPGPDDLWLEGPAGKRYVCELRTIAVDPLAFDPRAFTFGGAQRR